MYSDSLEFYMRIYEGGTKKWMVSYRDYFGTKM